MTNTNPLKLGLEAALEPFDLDDDEIHLIYTCFVHVNAGSKFIPGQHLIKMVYKLTFLLIRSYTDAPK